MSSKFAFDKKATALGAATKQAAIQIMRATKQYFGDAFDKEGLGISTTTSMPSYNGWGGGAGTANSITQGTTTTSGKWKEVSRRTPGSNFNKARVVGGRNKPSGKTFVVDQGDDYATRKILAGTTGRLRYKTEKADSAITNKGAVSTMINPVPYAGYLNDGTPYMLARPFMKQTDQLTEIQLEILKQKTNQIWTKV